MSFSAPLGLLALLAVPLAIAALMASRRRATRYAIRMPAASSLALAAGAEPPWRRHLPTALMLAAIAALALALAKPQVTVSEPIQGATVMLVTDHSGSMSADDVDPDRLTAANHAAETFLARLPRQTRVGVVTYSDAPDGTQPPTTDRDTVLAAIRAQTAEGATATGEALQTALDALSADRRGTTTSNRPPAAIVLLSDGKTTAGRDPVEVARTARADKVPIYTVALGSEDATIPDPTSPFGRIPVPPDPQTLSQIAEVSGGRAFTTADADQLQSIYKSLGSRLATKDKHKEVTAGFATAGLVLLLGAGLVSLRFAGRLP